MNDHYPDDKKLEQPPKEVCVCMCVCSHLTCVQFLECCYHHLASLALLSLLSLSVDC